MRSLDVQTLNENDEHVRARDFLGSGLRRLGLNVWQEYEFTIIGFFGTSVDSITKKVQSLAWSLKRMAAGVRYISPNTQNTAFYTHYYDIYYEGVSKHSYSDKPLTYRGVFEIDGEIHDPEVDLKRGIRQIKNDKLAELVFEMWFPEPKEFTRLRKSHIIAVMKEAGKNHIEYNKEYIDTFIQYLLKGKYKSEGAFNISDEGLLAYVDRFINNGY